MTGRAKFRRNKILVSMRRWGEGPTEMKRITKIETEENGRGLQ